MKKLLIICMVLTVLMSLPVVAEEAPLVTPTYVSPTVPTVRVDGKVTAEEWGEPDAVYTYDDFRDTPGWVLWDYFKDDIMYEQSLEMYARRDDKNLYFAFRFVNVDHIDYEYTGTDGWKHPGMRIAIGAYDPQTVIANKEMAYGVPYENWYYCNMRPKYDPTRGIFVDTFANGVNKIEESKTYKPNAAIFVDPDTYSYNYEIVLPYKDLYGVVTADTEQIVMAFEMTDALAENASPDMAGNRWFVSQAVRLAVEADDPQAFLKNNPLLLIYAEEPIPEPEPEIEESVVDDIQPEPMPQEPPSATPWILLGVSVVAILVGVGIVLAVIKHKRKEK